MKVTLQHNRNKSSTDREVYDILEHGGLIDGRVIKDDNGVWFQGPYNREYGNDTYSADELIAIAEAMKTIS